MTPNTMLAWRTLMEKFAKSRAGQFASGAGSMLIPPVEQIKDIPTGLGYMARHPLDSMKLLGGGMQDASQSSFEKMFAAPTTSEAIGHGLAGAIPMIGPAAGMAGEEIGAGNTARGLGMATALLAPSLYHGVKPVVGEALKLNEAVGRAKNIGLIRAARQGSEYDALANSARNANANYAATTPYPPMPDGPSGSLSQLRDDPNVRVPGMADPYTTSLPEPAPIDPLTGLPTRRDALKAGGAAALATAIGARAMEGMGKVPEIAAAADPVLGRAAPSALGREGFYRELKHRVTDFDPEGWDEGAYGTKVPTKLTEGVVSPRSGIDPSDPFDSDVMMNPDKERYFLSRMYSADADTDVSLPAKAAGSTDPFTQFNKHSDAPRYIKQVYKMGREENLREALRKFTDNLKAHDAGTVEEFDSQLRPHRIVHSEITPEAAMRLNTIEKPKVPIALSIPDKFDGPVTHFKLVDPDGVTQSVAAVPVGKRGAPLKKYMDRINSSMDRHVELEPNRSAMDLEPITPEEFNAMANKSWHNIEGYNGTPDRPNTVGISPRYTKRVSIRLLKDTMAAHIAENKRAAGKKPPPLLAKSPVLQDNPALTRFDFLRGVKKP